MLTENQVIDAVAKHLQLAGFDVISTANTNQRGYDLYARKCGEELVVEAKGGTSAKTTSARHGLPFNSNQVHTHVAMAILRAMEVEEVKKCQIGLAFPDEPFHRSQIACCRAALTRLGYSVYWVAENLKVTKE